MKEFLVNTGVVLFLVAFVLLITAIVYAIRKKKIKKLMIISLTCFVISILLIGPNADKKQSNTEKAKVTQSQSSKKETEKSSKKDEKHNKSTEEKQNKKENDNKYREVVTLINIVDGDTVKLNYKDKNTTFRLLLIDTPETKDPRKPVEKYGPKASRFTRDKLTDTKKLKLNLIKEIVLINTEEV